MNKIRFSFSLRYGNPQESVAIKKLLDIPAARRATLIRGWISNNLSKMPAHFSWYDARESINPPSKFSLYLDPLAPEDGDIIDSISKIPTQFITDWIRERICAAQAPNKSDPTPSPAPIVIKAPTLVDSEQSQQQIVIEAEAPKKQSSLSGLFS